MEQRHDWAKMNFTLELFKYVLTVLIPEVIVHSQSQDEEQVRGHYDREHLLRTCADHRTLTCPLQEEMTFTNGARLCRTRCSELVY